MSSKLVSKILGVICVVALIATGCSLRKTPPSSTQFNLTAGQLGCLDKASKQIPKYFQGSATEKDVDEIWTCASSVLTQFSTETHGSTPGVYKAEELRSFLAKYFIKEMNLTEDLTAQVGLVKQALVGGEAGKITIDEIEQLQNLIEVLRPQSKSLLKFLPLGKRAGDTHWTGFGNQTWREISAETLDDLENTANNAMAAIGLALKKSGRPYRFDQLEDLINSILGALPSDGTYQATREALSNLLTHFDLIVAVKQTLVMPDPASTLQRLDPGGISRSNPKFQQALNDLSVDLGSVLNGGQSYDFAQMDQKLRACIAMIPSGGEYDYTRAFLQKLLKSADLVVGVGEVTIDTPVSRLDYLLPHSTLLTSGSDWSDLLRTASKLGSVLVRLEWYMDKDRFTDSQQKRMRGDDLQILRAIFDRVNNILNEDVQRHASQLITFDELERFISALPTDHLPASPQSIKLALRPLIRRIIGGTDLGPGGRRAEGINLEIVKKIQDIFYNWYEGQRFLETLYARLEQQDGDSPGAGRYVRDTLFTSAAAVKTWREVYQQSSPEWTSVGVLAARRLEVLIRALRPLFDQDGEDSVVQTDEIVFPPYSKGLRYSLDELTELNWMQSLSRLLIRGYADMNATETTGNVSTAADVDIVGVAQDSRVGRGVSEDEFKQFFADFKPIGVDLKVFDPDDPNSASKRFMQGDVFSYVSDGNGYLDLNETTALLAFSVSAMRKASRIHHDIASKCPVGPKPDKYGQPLIDDQCYREMFFTHLEDYWSHLDEMEHFYLNLGPQEQANFRYYLEVAARKRGGYQPGVMMASDDTQGFVGALQYIEAIFTRYDLTDSGYLNPSEAATAFPVFEGSLKAMAKKKTPPQDLSDAEADLVFTYFLAKGKQPQGATDLILWGIEKNVPFGGGDFKADRMRIVQIFAALSGNSTGAMK